MSRFARQRSRSAPLTGSASRLCLLPFSCDRSEHGERPSAPRRQTILTLPFLILCPEVALRRLRESAVCRNVLLPGTLVLWLAGCHRWVPVEPPGQALREAAESPSTGTFRVYLANETVIEGRPIGVSKDSVVLRVAGDSATLAVDDIQRAELRKAKVTATVLLMVGIIAVPLLLYGIGLAIACSGQGEKCLS